MIDPSQIRAARTLLSWDQEDLRVRSGVSVNWISKIESGKATPRPDIVERLQEAFEREGVEFLSGPGVRMQDSIVTTYDGKEANKRLLEDIHMTLNQLPPGEPRELLITHLDESVVIREMTKDLIMEQIRERNKSNITHRLLVSENAMGDTMI